MAPILIIGSGLGGYTLAKEIRKLDDAVPLHIITADDGRYYSKPMLSNGLAKNKTPDQLAMADPQKMATDLNATITPQTRISAIDAQARQVHTADAQYSYSRLVLALGADPLQIPLQGTAAQSVLSVNDLLDYTAFRSALQGARRVLIIGAGLIGCEFANDLHAAGIGADIVDLGERPLNRLLPPQAAAALRRALEDLGVNWNFQRSVQQVDQAGARLEVILDNGSHLSADVVLSAIGLRPRLSLAQAAGLAVNRGIVVDRHLRSSDPNIYALGDCAEVQGLVLPFVMPIMQAARALARTLTGSEQAVHYPAMPVVVKTPACPLVACPPLPGVHGAWQEEVKEDGVRALFYDDNGQLRGFALTGAAVQEKTALGKQIAAWLS